MVQLLHRGRAASAKDLPTLHADYAEWPPKKKASFALQSLREAAVSGRQSICQPFYSIRAVATHFSLPATTVTRLYSQLKNEGVLGTIWGSRTIIEPLELDNDVRVKGVVALPVPLRAFSVVSTYRSFLACMQQTLWRERFGSRLVFYDEAMFDSVALVDALLATEANVVVWLTPPGQVSSVLLRLNDRGIKSVCVLDEIPINGELGYYLSWIDACSEVVATWKRLNIRRVIAIRSKDETSPAGLRVLRSCAAKYGLDFEIREEIELAADDSNSNPAARSQGVVFLTAKALIHFTGAGTAAAAEFVRHNRVLYIHGRVDLPFQRTISACFDTVSFDWPSISKRLVRDLVVHDGNNRTELQAIFKASWHPALR